MNAEENIDGDRYLDPGTRVQLDSLINGDTRQSELGVVVHCWLDDEIQMYDCYVAFFGAEFPNGKPVDKPYILRFAAASLVTI